MLNKTNTPKIIQRNTFFRHSSLEAAVIDMPTKVVKQKDNAEAKYVTCVFKYVT